jgi:hypothetical protein
MATETFHHFRVLALEEVRARAERAELRRRRAAGPEALDLPCEEAAWRWLHREMRRAKAAIVADLKTTVVESYAYRLGYGYFRVRYGRRDAFMPFASR